MIPIFLGATASDTISLLTAGPAEFSSGQSITHALSIYQRHIRSLYQRVTNWPPPRRSSPNPEPGCQLWQAQVWPSSHILPSAPLCFMLNRDIFRAEATPLLFLCLNGPFCPASYFLFLLPICSEPAPIPLNHETITKYKSSFLLLCHSDSPSTLSHLFSLFFPPSLPLSLIFSLSCSPPYTNTTLINCGTGNYIEPTGKFHFHLHLDYRIFHSYQSAVQDQCVHGFAHMQTQLFVAFLYSHWCTHTGWTHICSPVNMHIHKLC